MAAMEVAAASASVSSFEHAFNNEPRKRRAYASLVKKERVEQWLDYDRAFVETSMLPVPEGHFSPCGEFLPLAVGMPPTYRVPNIALEPLLSIDWDKVIRYNAMPPLPESKSLFAEEVRSLLVGVGGVSSSQGSAIDGRDRAARRPRNRRYWPSPHTSPSRPYLPSRHPQQQQVQSGLDLTSRASRVKDSIRTCHVLIFLGILIVATSLIPAILRSNQRDLPGGFAIAQYIVNVGMFAVGCAVAIHVKRCTCWSTMPRDSQDIELEERLA